VLLVAKNKDVRPDLGSMIRIMLVAIATALLAWLAIGIYFAISISRPLLRVQEGTEEMARGNYTVQVPVHGHSEISQLAASFNTMASQVRRSNQILKDFVANVSHDLRTPLTLITGFSQALLDGTAEHDEVELSAEVINAEAIKMQHLVDDLLQLTRLESGLLTLDRHPVDVSKFVQTTLDRIGRAHAAERYPTLVNRVPAGIPPILADPERLERVLQNLLENAIEYTPPEGEIVVTARRPRPGLVEIGVSDTGIGIPEDQVSRIFERFYRSDKSRERATGHSGLGLAIVSEIVEAHGGRVTVQSEVGRGTTFRFTIPAAPENDSVVEQRATGEPVEHFAS
jgi:signal transduction histidine kinase